MLTNYNTIKRQIKEYNELIKKIEDGKMDELSKKEKSMAMIRFNRLKKRYEGVVNMRRCPDGIFVIDGYYERQAVAEANVAGMKVFSLLGTTGDPATCTSFVPGNVNNVKSLEYIIAQLEPVMKKCERQKTARPPRNFKGAPKTGDAK